MTHVESDQKTSYWIHERHLDQRDFSGLLFRLRFPFLMLELKDLKKSKEKDGGALKAMCTLRIQCQSCARSMCVATVRCVVVDSLADNRILVFLFP